MQTHRPVRLAALLSLIGFASVSTAYAGMTVYGLRDIYQLRLQELSFFGFLLILCALLFKLLWNYAIKGFNFLPRINFRQSLCLAILFGLATLLVLTMISGIREVLTPGAWRRQGTSYRLNDPSQEPARRRSLEQLRGALFDYARTHDGKFPAHDFVSEIPEKIWEAPDQLGSHYIYSGGLTTNAFGAFLAIEPPNFGGRRFALLVSGDIKELTSKEIETRLQEKARP